MKLAFEGANTAGMLTILITSDNDFMELRFLIMCLLGFAGFFRVRVIRNPGEGLSRKIMSCGNKILGCCPVYWLQKNKKRLKVSKS